MSEFRLHEPSDDEVPDVLTIQRVANGWIITPARGLPGTQHVAVTADELAQHVRMWATLQVRV